MARATETKEDNNYQEHFMNIHYEVAKPATPFQQPRSLR